MVYHCPRVSASVQTWLADLICLGRHHTSGYLSNLSSSSTSAIMYISILTLCVLIPAVLAAATSNHKPARWVPGSTQGSDALAERGLRNLRRHLKTKPSTTCSLKTAHRRREWDSLSAREKRSYIKAVQCLQTIPSISGDLAPGAQSRFDDFQAAHMNQTLTVHATVRYQDLKPALRKLLIMFRRATSWRGIATISMLTRLPCERNATIKDTNLISTGLASATLSPMHQSSTVPIHRLEQMEHMTLIAYP